MHGIGRFQLIRVVLVATAMLVMASRTAGQERITLRPAATVAGDVVRVADIAEVQGAASLGEVVVVTDLRAQLRTNAGGMVVDMARVRAALEKQKGINWGRLTLSGVACRVRGAASEGEDVVASAERAPRAEDGATLRDAVSEWVARSYGCGAEDVRLKFDESQGELLATATRGLTVTIRSLGASDTLSLAVTTYRGDVIVNAGTIRVTPLIRREVAIASRRIQRGEAISAEAMTRDEQWVPPSVTAVEAGALVGVNARNRIEAGTVIRAEHVEAAVVVKKGEIVTVDCVSGGVVVRAMARAMSAGRDGEVIAFQYLESKRSFNARVNGAGRAVVVAMSERQGEEIDEAARVGEPVKSTRSKVARSTGGQR